MTVDPAEFSTPLKQKNWKNHSKTSFFARFLLLLSIILLLLQALSQGRRGGRGETDVGVFYRTTQLLRDGIGPELYTLKDARDGWPIAIPPAGLSLFQPLAALDTDMSSTLWAVFNVLLALGAVYALRRFFLNLDRQQRLHLQVFPYAAAIFFLLAGGSVQVGQFSLLFTACWVFALLAAATSRSRWLPALLALPSAIKLYPALMLAFPLSAGANWRQKAAVLFGFLATFAFWSLVVPFAFYGERTWGLNVSFWDHTIFDRAGRVSGMQSLGAHANQSLDAVLLRYLTHDGVFHSAHTYLPHLDLASSSVLGFANLLRVVIIGVTSAMVIQWRRNLKAATPSPYNLLTMAALWSVTLYLILPETRARYAIYTFLGFIPLLVAALGSLRAGRKWEYVVQVTMVVLCFLLVLSFIPYVLRTFGLGLLGALLLWVLNVAHVSKQSRGLMTGDVVSIAQ